MSDPLPIHILMLMPDPLTGQGGGMSRMVSYTQWALAQKTQPPRFTFLSTRLTQRRILNHLTTPLAYLHHLWLLGFGGVDVVHVNIAGKGSTWRKAVFALTAKAFGKPVVLHLHGSGYADFYARQPAPLRSMIRGLFQRADAVIVLGTGWRDFAVGELGLNRARVHIIDNGVPDPGIRATRCNAVPRIVFVGQVGHRKGVDVLLQALARLPADLPWTCAICGNGEVDAFRKLSADLGLPQDRLTFTGWQDQDQVRAQLAASDIFVLPSRAENQPVAIIEAMAMGLPVVSTAIGDIPNQVQDGVTGHVVPPSDAPALAAAMAHLLSSADLCHAYGDAGRARFEGRYSITTNLEKSISLYETLLR